MSAHARTDAPRLWLVLMRCHHALSKIAERSIQGTELCLTDFVALEALLHKGPQTITEIQSRVLLASGSMTAAVDRLEGRGLIRRTSASGDRRAKVLKLTPAGRRVAETAYGRHAADLESAMTVLSLTEKQQLRAILKKLGLFAAVVGAKTDPHAQGMRHRTHTTNG
jgi:MarR family transcriptional regulator, 2-MHQ and catechol-resistance regulon repressor